MSGGSRASTTTSSTTNTQNLNLQDNQGVSLAGNEFDKFEVNVSDHDAIDKAASITIKALSVIENSQKSTINKTVDAALSANTKALDFATRAQQSDGGQTAEIVKWVAGSTALVFLAKRFIK